MVNAALRMVFFILLIFNSICYGQDSVPDRIAVLPFAFIGVEQNYVQTAESILWIE